MLWWSERAGPRHAVRALTSRAGGVSEGRWAGLNLGGHVGDDVRAVSRNRALLAQHLRLPPERVLYMSQVHGTGVVVVDGPWASDPPDADALVTRTPGLALAVLVADCVPVLLHAPEEGIVAVAHAGRRGMVDGVVPATLDALRELGATTLLATVGPSICARCYEVPQQMRAEVAHVSPVAPSVTWRGRPALDVAAGVLDQLAPACSSVQQLPGCTFELPELYSYRRDGVTGRFAGLAWLEEA
ncbi:MAG: peptidoglycan editing factor PgeF [Actinomycetes bacterium]